MVLGQSMWVATVDELLGMKRDTIAIYGTDIQTNPRPQDFVDVGILSELSDGVNPDEKDDAGVFPQLSRILRGR